jgi:hypothetical protein
MPNALWFTHRRSLGGVRNKQHRSTHIPDPSVFYKELGRVMGDVLMVHC